MDKMLLVAAGGAVGATLRYSSTLLAVRLTGEPAAGTLFVNVAGSFLMGLLAVLIIDRAPEGWDRLAPLLLTGCIGGFTTFSAFSLDAIRLFEEGRVALSVGYVLASVAFSLSALIAGILLARRLFE